MESDTQNDTFPKAKIPTFDITESGLVPALSKIAKRAGITLTIKGSFSDALSGSATIENLGGDIQNVLDKLANTYGFWYEYKKQNLTIYPQKKFTVELPAAIYTDLFAGMANTISTIGAQDISLDRNNRTVTYTANRTVMDLQVNNVSRFRIGKDGSVYAANIGVNSASLPANGIFAPSANTLGFAAGSTIVASADVTGLDIKSGGLKINGVVVIDSAKNISTTGSVTANGGYKVGATTVIDSSGYLIAANTVTAGTDCTTVGVGGIAKDANGDLYICK